MKTNQKSTLNAPISKSFKPVSLEEGKKFFDKIVNSMEKEEKQIKQATPNIVRTVRKLELIKQRLKRLQDAEKEAKEEILTYMGKEAITLVFNDKKLASTSLIEESHRSFTVPEHLRLNLH